MIKKQNPATKHVYLFFLLCTFPFLLSCATVRQFTIMHPYFQDQKLTVHKLNVICDNVNSEEADNIIKLNETYAAQEDYDTYFKTSLMECLEKEFPIIHTNLLSPSDSCISREKIDLEDYLRVADKFTYRNYKKKASSKHPYYEIDANKWFTEYSTRAASCGKSDLTLLILNPIVNMNVNFDLKRILSNSWNYKDPITETPFTYTKTIMFSFSAIVTDSIGTKVLLTYYFNSFIELPSGPLGVPVRAFSPSACSYIYSQAESGAKAMAKRLHKIIRQRN